MHVYVHMLEYARNQRDSTVQYVLYPASATLQDK